jgi:hypothetical protein
MRAAIFAAMPVLFSVEPLYPARGGLARPGVPLVAFVETTCRARGDATF